jgi:dTDP-4-amino-4,6-dideoxygalactose transaminase
MHRIPFNRPRLVGNELRYLRDAVESAHLSAGGQFTHRCEDWLAAATGSRPLLTHSCTAALEMAALLLELEPGDEVVMPSFTFVSTANAFVLRGGVPVFVDVVPETLTLDVGVVNEAITARTRAIVPVHYGGIPCDMDGVTAVAAAEGLPVIEDAAQALMSTYKGRSAGSLGDLAALSFHETKNVTAGEGGALLLNDERFISRAEVLRSKGTDRARFFRGEVDKYTWVDLGSSYGLSELNAAFLWAQLEGAEELTADRLRTWHLYHDALGPLEEQELLRRPVVPEHVSHNAHMYYVLMPDLEERTALIEELNQGDINAVFHYQPLHSSRAGRRYGRQHGEMTHTDAAADRIVRLPLWAGMNGSQVERIVEIISTFVRRRVRA